MNRVSGIRWCAPKAAGGAPLLSRAGLPGVRSYKQAAHDQHPGSETRGRYVCETVRFFRIMVVERWSDPRMDDQGQGTTRLLAYCPQLKILRANRKRVRAWRARSVALPHQSLNPAPMCEATSIRRPCVSSNRCPTNAAVGRLGRPVRTNG